MILQSNFSAYSEKELHLLWENITINTPLFVWTSYHFLPRREV